ncbi:hypothetical protein [Paenibacillus radicis (ex Gao et al. 2016)]|uniref:Uncharacterized protein n=1 Tax=Paenibacillus radicis (ex Gao et al. 2016) TaxID=1737354 RepID=A0A917HTG7_9BACL|nr:hypothetical protein [Paenibacillus radicis (ex Gao et al. 2016)]GGG88693.1 hypothetical protein GCM10010918_54140 [Paenibacillus radicis (ex Gao et al. 2016)]
MEDDLKVIKEKVNNSLLKLDVADKYLLQNDLNERTIAHKLANYLQEEFNEYNVDCEYNKNVDEETGNKNIYFLKMDCLELNKEFAKVTTIDDVEYMRKSIYPDIVIHERGTNTRNLLIIEIKKSTNRTDRKFDFKKMQCYTDSSRHNKLSYTWGLFIEFKIGDSSLLSPELIWYTAGKEITSDEEIY